MLADLTDSLADGPTTGRGAAPSWVGAPTDDQLGPASVRAADLLGRLAVWIAGIYVRYSDQQLPDCWAWHPDIVEELLWLQRAWLAAYGAAAPLTAVGDWHDRHRPAVARRIHAYAGYCSLDNHLKPATRARLELPAETGDAIAAWWIVDREGPSPAPTAEHLAAAANVVRTANRVGGAR